MGRLRGDFSHRLTPRFPELPVEADIRLARFFLTLYLVSTIIACYKHMETRDPNDALLSQTVQLHELLTRLVRSCQLCDRNGCACYGLSASQFQALEVIQLAGEVSMNALASQMWLTPSTATRIVNRLVRKKLVTRCHRPGDRRVCCVRLTAGGTQLYARMRDDLLVRERDILEVLPPANRKKVLKVLQELLEVSEQAIKNCCSPEKRTEPQRR